jgi:hypothetical protein
MALDNFIPELWSSSLLVQLRKNLVHASLVNRDYEGEIRNFGDTVHINELGVVSVGDYTKNGSVTWQNMDSAQKSLLIDNAKYFAVKLDDIDQAQTKPKLVDGIMAEAAYSIADTIDQHLAGLYTYAGNTVTSLTVTAGNVLLNLSNMQLELDEANVPTGGRYVIIPPWYNQHLTLAASGAVSATATTKVMDDGLILNGYVGKLFGFNILMSNNVNNNGTVWNIMAFNRSAITHASQIAKIEATRIEDGFGDGIKGLYLYGSKAVRPAAMVKCAATKG